MTRKRYIIKVENLTKTYSIESERVDSFSAVKKFITGSFPHKNLSALKNINFSIEKGESVAIIGPNGSGKSTLLKTLAQIILPSKGKVDIKGNVTPFFSISSGLYEKLSVTDNIKICTALFDISPINPAFSEKILQKTGLEKYRNAKLSELSTGLKMRIPFITGLHANSDILLIDEIISVGDSEFRKKCFSLLKKMRENGKTIIFTTHETSIIENFASRIIKLENGNLIYDEPVLELENVLKQQPTQNSGEIHANSLNKYELFFKKLKTINGISIVQSKFASDEDLLLAHSNKWLQRLKLNNLTPDEEEELSLPNSKLLMPQAWKLAGATIDASQNALKCGCGISAIGGGHHAKKDTGEGFCPINDIAIAIKKLQKEKKIQKALIVDLDAHQGNGTAEIFQKDKNIFTYSAHQQFGYPEKREISSLDIELPPNIEDDKYLEILQESLALIFKKTKTQVNFDIAFYIAGADIYKNDLLGEMNISKDGIAERDKIVLKTLSDLKIPTVLLFAGGYAQNIEDTVDIYLNTVKEALKAFPSFNKIINF